jgi:hypothetical protein
LSRGVQIIPSSLISEDSCNEWSLRIIPLGFLTQRKFVLDNTTQVLQRSALNKQFCKQAEGLSHGFRTWLADEQRYLVPPLNWYQRKKVPLSMLKERKEELFRALNTILDAVTTLNLRDLDAEADAAVAADRGETSTQGVSVSSKGKDKVANPDWEDIPYNPVPIIPLSSRPRFSQVVGSSLESPIVPRSPISVAIHAMANAAGGAGPAGGNLPPLAYASGAQFNAQWDACVTDQARAALEQEAITRSPIQDVQFAAMVKINLRLQATVGQLTGQVQAATVAAQAAGNVDWFRPAAPPKYGNKKQSGHVRQWTPMIEDYLCTAPDVDYIRLASSYLEGGPRSLWTSVYEAYKAAHGGAKPPYPRQVFRETLEAKYGLQDLDQKF